MRVGGCIKLAEEQKEMSGQIQAQSAHIRELPQELWAAPPLAWGTQKQVLWQSDTEKEAQHLAPFTTSSSPSFRFSKNCSQLKLITCSLCCIVPALKKEREQDNSRVQSKQHICRNIPLLYCTVICWLLRAKRLAKVAKVGKYFRSQVGWTALHRLCTEPTAITLPPLDALFRCYRQITQTSHRARDTACHILVRLRLLGSKTKIHRIQPPGKKKEKELCLLHIYSPPASGSTLRLMLCPFYPTSIHPFHPSSDNSTTL